MPILPRERRPPRADETGRSSARIRQLAVWRVLFVAAALWAPADGRVEGRHAQAQAAPPVAMTAAAPVNSTCAAALVARLPDALFDGMNAATLTVVRPGLAGPGAPTWVGAVSDGVAARARAAGIAQVRVVEAGEGAEAGGTSLTLSLGRRDRSAVLTAQVGGLPPVTALAPLDPPMARLFGAGAPITRRDIHATAIGFGRAGILGLGAADLDGDGRDELVVARWAHVSTYRFERDEARVRLQRLGRVRWPTLARSYPAPRRAHARVFQHEGAWLVTRTDRAGATRLTVADGALVAEAVPGPCARRGRPFEDGCSQLVAGRDYYASELVPLVTPAGRRATQASSDVQADPGEVRPPEATSGPPVDEGGDGGAGDDATDTGESAARGPDERVGEAPASAAHSGEGAVDVGSPFYAREFVPTIDATGGRHQTALLVTPRGRLRVVVDGHAMTSGQVGAALAAGDMDAAADGAVEVLTSGYGRAQDPDRLRLYRAVPGGALQRVWESAELRGGVLHATGGDLFGTGRFIFAAFEASRGAGSRVWLIW